MIFEPAAPFLPSQFGIKPAREAWEREAAFALRRRVFCAEQHLFASDDRDADDDRATAIVAVDFVMGMAHRVVGTVRIFEREPTQWLGSRLAIEPAYRSVYGLGSALVHRAVTTARARGARDFQAHVQRANVAFFRRLNWEPLEDCIVHGAPHVRMRADLAAYPATDDETRVAIVDTRRAS